MKLNVLNVNVQESTPVTFYEEKVTYGSTVYMGKEKVLEMQTSFNPDSIEDKFSAVYEVNDSVEELIRKSVEN